MPTMWIDTLVNNDVASGGGQLPISLARVLPGAVPRPQMTLTRTLIGLDIAATVHDSGEGSQLVSCGIGIGSLEAFASSIFPDPSVATDHPTRGWVWRAAYRIFAFAADQPAIFTRRLDLDIRAQRKLENGEAYLVVDNVNLEGVAITVRVSGYVRQLWIVG